MVNSRSCCLPLRCGRKREVALVINILPASAGDARNTGWIPGLGRSPEKGNCSPFPYSCLENPTTEEPGGLQSMGLQRVGHD